ncbi:MAG: LuxR C-terminal-related transcriptional regulator [Actinomycetota bacterium]|nr:LuxR C-terminal-related transcriptional regulator [Actinomycetota bacterium]
MFIGRKAELERLRVAVETDGGSVLLTGVAGVGKTAIVERLAGELGGRLGVHQAEASCGAAEVPLGPFLPVLAAVRRAPSAVEDRLLFLEHELVERAAPRRLLLTIDDAHFLDPVSFVLVRNLTVHGHHSVVLTARSTEMWPLALTNLVKDRIVDRVELGPLRRDEVDVLVRANLDGAVVEAAALEAVWRSTEGNPLFVRELLAAAIDDGSLVRAGGRWELDGPLRASPLLRVVLGRRLRSLPAQKRVLVDAFGETDALPIAVAERLCRLDDIVELEDAGLVTTRNGDGGVRVRSGHPMFGEVARELMTPARRLRTRHRLAAALDAVDGENDSAVRLRGQLEVALGGSDLQVLEAAARSALQVCDAALALECAEAAVEAGGGFTARLARANALAAKGRIDDAEAAYLQLIEEAPGPRARAGVVIEYATDLAFQQLGDLSRAARTLEESIVEQDEPEASQLRSMLAYILYVSGENDRALELIETARGSTSVGAADVGLRSAEAGVLAVRGRPVEAIACADKAIAALVRSEVDPFSFGSILATVVWDRFLAFWQSGRADEAKDPAAPIIGTAAAVLVRHAVIRDLLPVVIAAMRGKLDFVVANGPSLSAERAATVRGTSIFAAILASGVQAMRGDPDGANQRITAIERTAHGRAKSLGWWIGRTRTLILVAKGRRREAAARCVQLASEHPTDHLLVTISLHDVVRLGEPSLVREALLTQASRSGATWLDRVCAAHAEAETGKELTAVSVTFEEGGIDHYACEASAQAARAHRAAGELVEAAEADHRTQQLLERCGGVLATPAVDPVVPLLTEREYEVARLAVNGLTNREIAERLGSSPRTVGNQLQHVYDKLDVHARADLAALWPRPDRQP